MHRRSVSLVVALFVVACQGNLVSEDPARDAAPVDGGAQSDGGPIGELDGGGIDPGSVIDGGGAIDGGPLDAGEPLDAGSPDAGAPDGGPPCSEPLGSACNPIVIDRFPFRHDGNTASSGASLIGSYACAPTIDEGGNEIHYELRIESPVRVSFVLTEASGVDVDVHVLRSADPASCLARANTTLDQPLGAGTWRVIVDTYRSGTPRAGSYQLSVTTAEPAARSLGTMWNTYYYLANEADHSGAQDTPIYDASCREIARVRRAFHDSVCIEGSGVLADGRVINYATTCTSSCASARTCGSASYRICYSVLDPTRYPWGMGAGSRALEPDRSMAVDPDFVALGSWVYFEELDGLVPPGSTTPHDGCLRADDVGGAIDGNHFDFFAGTRARWRAWETLLPTRSNLRAWLDHPRCYPTP